MSNKLTVHVSKVDHMSGVTFCGLTYNENASMISKAFDERFLYVGEKWCEACISDPMCLLRDRL